MVNDVDYKAVVKVNATDIQRIHNEFNLDHRISYQRARKIKEECKRLYEEENGKVYLFNERLISLIWYQTYFGLNTFAPKRKKKVKDNASNKRSINKCD